jgi:hypothetical protein
MSISSPPFLPLARAMLFFFTKSFPLRAQICELGYSSTCVQFYLAKGKRLIQPEEKPEDSNCIWKRII